jgi:hypothetical protein
VLVDVQTLCWWGARHTTYYVLSDLARLPCRSDAGRTSYGTGASSRQRAGTGVMGLDPGKSLTYHHSSDCQTKLVVQSDSNEKEFGIALQGGSQTLDRKLRLHQDASRPTASCLQMRSNDSRKTYLGWTHMPMATKQNGWPIYMKLELSLPFYAYQSAGGPLPWHIAWKPV